MSRIFPKSIFGCLILCILFAACKKPEEVVIREDKDEFTMEDQQEIGKSLERLMERFSNDFNRLDRSANLEVYEYINTILGTIVNTSMVETRNIFDWEVIILKDDTKHTAFAIPGGKICVYTGLLKVISSENELFSILAHELYYVEKGSLIEVMKDEYGAPVLSELEQGTESWGAIDLAETIHDLAYSKAMVTKADKFTVEMICPFQYEARGLKSFIERASATTENVQWLKNRPGSEDRLEVLEELVKDCGEEELTFAERYESYKNLLP